MKKYVLIVECALEHKGKFLIIKRPQGVHAGGLLSFPGGKVEEQDEGSDLLRAAAKREVFEEVGLVLEDPIEYVTTSHFISEVGTEVIDSVFYCKLEKTILKVVASPREVPEYYWMNPKEINQSPHAPEWLKEYVRLIESRRSRKRR